MLYFGIGIVFAVIILISYMYYEAHCNQVKFETVNIRELPERFQEFSIFFISDIHRRLVEVELIKKIGEADIVLVGGDLVEKGVSMRNVQENISRLRSIAPVYVVWGNNDYDGDIKKLQENVVNSGGILLNNESIQIKRENERIELVGVDDFTIGRADLAKALTKSVSNCRILLSHNPGIEESIEPEHGIRLILTGHTHGGQIRLGPLGIAKKGGWYKTKTHQLLVSNGYGSTHLPLRLGAKSETHHITLKKA